MKGLLFAAAAAALVATPASAQVYPGAGPGGMVVQVGPFGLGAGPPYGGPYGAYGSSGYPTADPYWYGGRPGGYANGALGGSGYGGIGSPSWGYGYGGYTDYGSYGVPIYGGYGAPGYGGPVGAYAAGSAYALGINCTTTRQRIVTRGGRVIYRTRTSC